MPEIVKMQRRFSKFLQKVYPDLTDGDITP